VPRVDRVSFSLSVGTTVPRHVHLVEVPPVLIDIHPEWRGYEYFVVQHEIVIVDRSRNIVAVVEAGPSHARSGGSGAATLDLSQAEIRQVQEVLIEKGFYEGDVDGIFGPRTREALITFQRQEGLEASGRIDTRTVTSLGLSERIGESATQGTTRRERSTIGRGEEEGQPSRRGRDGGQRNMDRQRSGGQTSTQPSRDQSTTGQGGDRHGGQTMGPGQRGAAGAPTTGQGGDGRGPGAQSPKATSPSGGGAGAGR
jgi:peptidoglycan hydrolase-like protein with peptidoglycan-binding domain